tara:strand:+ start:286 stop:1053 length:768 start_codon:yes stop_codon:yes gene_type:complete
MSYNQILQHSSHLWISDHTTAQEQTVQSLQNVLCKNNSCQTCTICTQIKTYTHPWTTWLEPQTSYTIDQIDEVIKSVQFTLDAQEFRFFIFTQAEALTTTCCNRLLKTIEEPHHGYHFIFLTDRPQELLPTLKSRCFTKTLQSQSIQHVYHDILEPFITYKFNKPIQFLKLIDKQNIKETATKEIIDLLIEHFYKKLKQTAQESSNHQDLHGYIDIILLLKQALLQLPVQGSSKLFWKNLYLAFDQHQHHVTKTT